MARARKPKNRVVEPAGAKGAVYAAERTNGEMEAKKWLDAQNETIKSSFGVLFKKITVTGWINNERQFRKLKDDIYEFKRGQNRILTFRKGCDYYLTHRIKKGGQKCHPREIKRAETIRDEFLAILAGE